MAGSIKLKIGGGFAALLVILLIVATSALWRIQSLVETNRWLTHTHQVLSQIQSLRLSFNEGHKVVRQHMMAPSQHSAQRLVRAAKSARLDLDQLVHLARDNPHQQKDLVELSPLMESRLQELEQLLKSERKEPIEDQPEIVDLLSRVESRERTLLEIREDEARTAAHRTFYAVLTLTLGAFAFFSLLGWLAVRAILGPLKGLIDGAEALAGGTWTPLRIRSDDELGRTTAAFNQMAHQLTVDREMRASAEQALRDTVATLEKRKHEDTMLARMTELLQTVRSLDEASTVLAPLLTGMFEGASGAVYLTSSSRNLTSKLVGWGQLELPDSFSPEDCWALRLGKLYGVRPEQSELSCPHSPQNDLGRSWCVPLMAQGETLGVLAVCEEGPTLLHTLLAPCAEQLSLALGNLRLRETLRQQSIRDPLTGLFNRRFLEESLERELHRAHRNATPLCVMMVDVDHFKRFNDNHGHEAGDLVLQEMGKLLRACTRGEDVACRYGGEEFCMIFPGMELEAALARAEQMRQSTSEIHLMYQGAPLETLTISIGLALYPLHAETGLSLVEKADAALYRAKRAGRNRAEVASS